MKYHATGATLTGIVLLFGGCATAPIESQRIDLPGIEEPLALEEIPTLEAPVLWIRQFGDETLNALVAEALVANIGLDVTKANARAAETAARISGSNRFPGLSLGLDSARQQSRFSFLGFQQIEIESHSLTFGSQWEIDLWGRLNKTHASGLAQWEAAEADVEAMKLSLAGQVAHSWFNTLEADLQWRLAQDSARSLEQKLSSLERRYERGLASSLDLRLTRAQSASSRGIVTQRQMALGNAKRGLETVLGRYPSASQNSAQALPVVNAPLPADLSSLLIARRPDLLAAERRLAASLARSESVSRNWLPQIRLTGSLGTTSDEFANLLDSDLSVWSLASGLTAPIFSAGRLKAERQQARALSEVQMAQYRKIALDAFREVENALSAESDLEQLQNQTALAARENGKAEDLAWEQYQRGLIDITSLLDAQRRSDDSASQLISVQNQRLQNRVQLHLALGGDFE